MGQVVKHAGKMWRFPRDHHHMKRLLSLVTLVMVAALASPACKGLQSGLSVHRVSLHDPIADHMNYLLYVPPAYSCEAASEWPLILLLHGSEQRGDDLVPLQRMSLLTFAEHEKHFPFIAVIPQCPRNIQWPPSMVKKVLDSVETMLRIDRDRVYLTGFSMGGYGTWQTAAAFPGTFAAIAPVCGMSDLSDAPRLTGLPIWAFHGAQDLNVPVTESRKMIAILRKAGTDARITVYPDLAHDCWTTAYWDPQLYLWFLDHSLSEGSRRATRSGEATGLSLLSILLSHYPSTRRYP
jgi:predicted peptidase